MQVNVLVGAAADGDRAAVAYVVTDAQEGRLLVPCVRIVKAPQTQTALDLQAIRFAAKGLQYHHGTAAATIYTDNSFAASLAMGQAPPKGLGRLAGDLRRRLAALPCVVMVKVTLTTDVAFVNALAASALRTTVKTPTPEQYALWHGQIS